MTIIAQTGSEGTAGATVTSTLWGMDALTNNGAGTIVFDADAALGSGSVKITQGTGAIFGAWSGTTIPTPLTDAWGEAYLKFTAYPTGANHVIVGVTSGAVQAFAIDISSVGTLIMRDSANTNIHATTAAVPLNTWVRVEWHVNHTAGTFQVQLYNTANALTVTEDTGALAGSFGANMAQFQIGAKNTTPTIPTFRVDTITLSTTKVGPLGSAVVDPPVVNTGADFSRTLGAGSVNVTCTATPATGGTITGYAWTQVSGPTVTLTNATTATVTCGAPASAGDVVLRCTVTQTG